MVATDIAARGIDVEGISHVVNFDTPTFAEDYIHRIGRTGRATATGDAITFVSNQEHKYLKSIERYTDKRFELKRYPGFDYAKRPPLPVKAGEEKSPRDRHDGGHSKRDGHRERRSSESFRKPHGEQRPSESTARPHMEHRHPESTRRPQGEQRRTEIKGRPMSDHRRTESSERPHSEHRRSEYAGKPRDQFKPRGEFKSRSEFKPRGDFKSRERREDSSRRGTVQYEKPRFENKPSMSPSIPPAPEGDWRTLMATMEEGRGGLKKKLKRLFIRDKA
jgi:superfamily II DNA/RNA helicase